MPKPRPPMPPIDHLRKRRSGPPPLPGEAMPGGGPPLGMSREEWAERLMLEPARPPAPPMPGDHRFSPAFRCPYCNAPRHARFTIIDALVIMFACAVLSWLFTAGWPR